MRTTTPLIIVSLSSLLPGIAAAQNQPGPVESVIVTGTRISASIDALDPQFTIIDRQQIEERKDASTLDLLRSVAGIQISQTGGRGGNSSIFLRGGDHNFVAVFIDGIKVNDPNDTRGGSFDFATLSLDEIERIEITKTASSSIYGSDGLSGSINIVTRTASKTPSVATAAELGSDSFQHYSLIASGPLKGKEGWSLTLADDQEGRQSSDSTFHNKGVSAKFVLTPTTYFETAITSRYSDTKARFFPEDSGGPEFAVLRDKDNRTQRQFSIANTGQAQIASNWELNYAVSLLNKDDQTASSGVLPGIRDGVPANSSDSTLERVTVSTNFVYQSPANFTVAFGADHQSEDGESRGEVELAPGFSLPTDYKLDRSITGVFGEIRHVANNGFGITASLRIDSPDRSSSETTSGLRMHYSPNSHTTFFASRSDGFKLPSFYSLANPLVGNADLVPETSTNWELGARHDIVNTKTTATLTYFSNRFENLVDFDADIFLIVNREQVDTSGFDLEVAFSPAQAVEIAAHATYVDIDVKGSATILKNRPDFRGGATIAWNSKGNFSSLLSWLYVGDVYDTSIPTGARMIDSYNRLDGSFTWKASKKLDIWLAIDNILDANYSEAIGFRAPGLKSRIGFRYDF